MHIFTVAFDTMTKTISFPDASFASHVPQGVHSITFTLNSSAVAAGVVFPSAPVQWLEENGQPTENPAGFLLLRNGPDHIALWDFNAVKSATSYYFRLIVFYDGQFYSSSDPTIINDPPTS